tara:strand:- start:3405 stop:4136 length:732 start_codon:yes stop_codon:yes gene_type:complete
MALQNVVDSLDNIDVKYHSLYAEKDGKYHLDAELAGGDPVTLALEKVSQFRESNIDLTNRLAALEAENKASKQAASDANAAAESATSNSATMADRVAALETSSREANEQAATATQQARRATLSDSLGKLGAANGVQDTALERFSQATIGSFSFDGDGAAFVVGDGGRPKLSEVNPGQRMSAEEHVKTTLQAETFWLKPSGGDGAGGDGGSGGAGTKTITQADAAANWSTHEKGIADGTTIVSG